MKKNRIILSVISVGVLYLTGYGISRIKHELVHRETWDGGWNRHWVVLAEPEPNFDLFAQLQGRDDPGFHAAMHRYRSEYKAISRRRTVLGILFLPARCLESLAWWVVNPRYSELGLQTVIEITKGPIFSDHDSQLGGILTFCRE